MRIVDLTGLIEEGMWSYGPPLPDVSIRKSISQDAVTNYAITLGSITGTYLETSAHRFPNGPSLDDIPIKRFITRAAVIKLRTKRRLGHITEEELCSSGVVVKKGDALLFSTGWDRMWTKENFVKDSPHFTKEAMDWVLERQVSILGGDIPCFDDPREPNGLVKGLFESGALILAPLVNVWRIRKNRIRLIALAPRVKGTCGLPCRAVALEE
jgi:arylformamidase